MSKIAILDSGVRHEHPEFRGKDIVGFSLGFDDAGSIVKTDNFQDSIGHGTAIFLSYK